LYCNIWSLYCAVPLSEFYQNYRDEIFRDKKFRDQYKYCGTKPNDTSIDKYQYCILALK
jgi:hypothetical protein